jgi:transposase
MLKAEDRMEISVLARHGSSIRAIARATGLSRNTVRRYLRGGEEASVRKASAKRAEKLDPFKDYISERIAAAAPDAIPAVVLFRELWARGYDGGETRVKDFVRGLRTMPAPDPVVRFETESGRQMQADWATVGRGAGRLCVFVATLGWSRAAYVEFCTDERIETLIRCHEHAFAAFGGVSREVLLDNMKTVVLERDAYGAGRHRFHPGFLDYAGHAGFLPRLCRPYRACTKGEGRALHPLSEGQLLGAVCRRHEAGRRRAGPPCGQCRGVALAARGSQGARPRHHGRGAGCQAAG